MKKGLVLAGLIHKEHGIFLNFTEQFHVFQYMDLHCHSDCSYYRDYHHGHYDGIPEHNYRCGCNNHLHTGQHLPYLQIKTLPQELKA